MTISVITIILPFSLPETVHSWDTSLSFLYRNWSQKVKIIFQTVTHGYVHLLSFLFGFGELANNRFALQGEIRIHSWCPPHLVHAYTQISVCRCTMDACSGKNRIRTHTTRRKSLACGNVMLHHGIHRDGPLLYQSPIVRILRSVMLVVLSARVHG